MTISTPSGHTRNEPVPNTSTRSGLARIDHRTDQSEKSGREFTSLAFREAEEQPAKPRPKAPAITDRDIPF